VTGVAMAGVSALGFARMLMGMLAVIVFRCHQ
jgi:hypothetical protein